MPRPNKNNAEYFSHDADASSDGKILFIESQLGLSGYALYFKTLETLARADGYEIDWNELQPIILARKFGTDAETVEKFIVAATNCNIRALRIEDGKLFSDGLKKRMLPLGERRAREAIRIEERRAQAKIASNAKITPVDTTSAQGTEGVVAATTHVVARTNQQYSKVKYSKVKVLREDTHADTDAPIATHPLQIAIATQFPFVARIKRQPTADECSELYTNFGENTVNEITTELDNHAGAPEKYTSVYTTVKAWCKRRVAETTQNGNGTTHRNSPKNTSSHEKRINLTAAQLAESAAANEWIR